MFSIIDPVDWDKLYPDVHDGATALLLAVTHVRDNGTDALVRLAGRDHWYVEADEPIEKGGTIPVIVHSRGGVEV